MARKASSEAKDALPVEIYVSTVDALYSDARSLIAGGVSATVAAAATAVAAREPVFIGCAALLALIAVLRWFDMSAYARQAAERKTVEVVGRWELRYIVGSAAFVAVLSSWCFLTFALSDDPAVRLISFSVSLAYLVGVTGRNFSSDRLVVAQALCAAAPMIAGLLIQMNGYYALLALLLVPFFISLRIISARLRSVLFDAVISSHNIRALALRFDTALSNMPHGLCMFDSDLRFVVSNARFLELVGPAGDVSRVGMSPRELVLATSSERFADAEKAGLADTFERRVRRRSRSTVEWTTLNERVLELTFQPMDSGGCVVLVEDVTERKKAAARIEHLASYDPLTGLPNRTQFKHEFECAQLKRGAHHRFALHFVDLDDFKAVNDTLGHSWGDTLLCEVADRMREIADDSILVSRFGGDEFVILQPLHEQDHRREAGDLVERLIAHVSKPYRLSGHEVVVGASVGVALGPEHGLDFERLLKCADMALYQSKGEGRGGYRFFEDEMDARARDRHALEKDLRSALANGEFELHYQPIVDVRDGRTAVCEALLRWRHPERGMVSPGEFIPIAEEIGAIVELGAWVIRQACQDCARWPGETAVAVNLSPMQFRRANMSEVVRDALAASGLPSNQLIVEITESVLLEDTDAIHEDLAALRALGAQIALDDFGTGYSSLSYLHRFPLNKIKIDRSFLAGIELDARTLTLLRGVARLSKSMGMSVVVEGVETEEQLAVLSLEPAIDQIQGFYFSKPTTTDVIEARLREGRAFAREAA